LELSASFCNPIFASVSSLLLLPLVPCVIGVMFSTSACRSDSSDSAVTATSLRTGGVTASRARITCQARLNRFTRSLPSTPECDATHRRSTAIPRSYMQFPAAKKPLDKSFLVKKGSFDPFLKKRSTFWQSESIVTRSNSSEILLRQQTESHTEGCLKRRVLSSA
jgi:hypothetical protein